MFTGRDDAVFRIGSDVSGAMAGMDRVGRAMGVMHADAQFLARAMGSVLGAAATSGLALVVKSSIDAQDALGKVAQKAGLAASEMGGLQYAAALADIDSQALSASVAKLNKSMVEAARGTKEQKAAFDVLGLSVKNADGSIKSADAMMVELADKFASFRDGPEKAALAIAIFGKSGADMIPFLNGGGEAIKQQSAEWKSWNTGIDKSAVAAQDFNDKMTKLGVIAKSFTDQLVADMLPAMNAVADAMLRMAQGGGKETEMPWLDRQKLAFEKSTLAFDEWRVSMFKSMGQDGLAAKAQQDVDATVANISRLQGVVNAQQYSAAQAGREALRAMERAGVTPANKPAAPVIPGGQGDQDAERELRQREADRRELLESMAKGAAAEIDQINRDASALSEAEQRIKYARDRVMEAMNPQLADERIHNDNLQALSNYYATHLELVEEGEAAIAAEKERYRQIDAVRQMQHDEMVVAQAMGVAGQLNQVMKNAGQERTALGRVLFAAEKALAVASIIIQAEVGAAKALGLGPYGIPLSAWIRGLGYASAGIVAGTAIAEASAENGFDIPAGVNPRTQLHEKEMVLPRAQADVIRGLARNGGGGAMKLTIINQTRSPIGNVTEQRISDNERALIIEEAVGVVGAQLGDPNSRTSRAMSRHLNVQRSR